MKRLHDLPISQKLVRIAVLSTSVALLIVVPILTLIEIVTVKKHMVAELGAQAGAIAANSVSALIFADEKSANSTLNGLSSFPSITTAVLYRKDHEVLAVYRIPREDHGSVPLVMPFESRPGEKSSYRFSLRRLSLSHDIYHEGSLIGHLHLQSDLKYLYNSLLRFFVIVIIGSLLFLIVIASLVSRLQWSVTAPLLFLAKLMDRVSSEKDYSVRAATGGGDELNALALGFNEMLEQIQSRDSELQSHRRDLEHSVEERTGELRASRDLLKRELDERARTEEELKKREAVLESLSYTAEQLLHSSDWAAIIKKCFARFGQVMALSRVYLFENHNNSDVDILTSERFEWTGPGISGHIKNPLMQELSYKAAGLNRWKIVLGSQGIIAGRTAMDFQPEERDFLDQFDIKSVLLVPVFMGKDWWGFVGFDDCVNERQWSQAEVDSLVTVGSILGGAFQRERSGRELIDARDKAMEASRAKSMFLANMSHEIRTPMNGVIGMTGLLAETQLTEEQQEFTETISNSANALLDIINDILDFSKIEAHKIELEVVDFDLRLAIEDAVEMLAVQAQKKGLEFISCIEHEVPSLLRGDPGRLRQILNNLIGNAVKFTSEGEISLQIRLGGDSTDKVQLLFSVSDTGCGISDEKCEIIFDAFTQVDSSNIRRYGGTGLGLSISKQLVEMMGGWIWVDSILGKGSTFWFSVPFEKQSLEAGTLPVPSPDISGTRVLVVDDNARSCRTLVELLGSWGCDCVDAPTARQALELLREAARSARPFRVALIDMSLLDMEGDELGAAIKAEPLLKRTALIAITAIGRRGEVPALRKIGYSGYLTKPFRQGQLRAIVQEITARDTDAETDADTILTRHTLAEKRKQRLRILIAEDNPVNQKIAVKILEKYGYRSDAVANGLEALKALETIPYDLVLMDVQMPELSGLQAARFIRDNASAVMNHAVPIIAITAHAMNGDREKCLEAGMNGYVTKPIQAKELIEAIELQLLSTGVNDEHQEYAKPADRGAEHDVYDRADLLKRIDNDDELCLEITDLFLSGAPLQIAGLKEAVAAGKIRDVEERAHALKGSAANVSAKELSALAAVIESDAREGISDGLSRTCDSMDEAFERLRSVISLLRDKGGESVDERRCDNTDY